MKSYETWYFTRYLNKTIFVTSLVTELNGKFITETTLN